MLDDPAKTGKTRLRAIGGTVAGLIAIALVAAGIGWWITLPATPDAFYSPPADAPAAPGRLIRSEPFATDVPAGARAWRILYTTRRLDGSPTVASGIVMVPAAAADRPRPVIAWAHGTTGIAPGCAPSLLRNPFADMPGTAELLQQGWALVATDYAGLGTAGPHAYLAGEAAAHGILDSVRAAAANGEWSLGHEVVLWGFSQGGHGVLWAGIRAKEYAPELQIAGVAAMAPASDLVGILEATKASPFGKLVSSFVFEAYRGAYPDVDGSYVSPAGQFIATDIARRCIADRKVLWSQEEARLLPAGGLFVRPLAEGPFGARLRENTPAAPIPVPLLLAQGRADDTIGLANQQRYVAARCSAGQAMDYREYPGLDHTGLVAADSALVPDLIRWTHDRLAGRPAANTCPRP